MVCFERDISKPVHFSSRSSTCSVIGTHCQDANVFHNWNCFDDDSRWKAINCTARNPTLMCFRPTLHQNERWLWYTLHCFWDTATYWLKIAYFSYPSLIRRPHSLSSLWNFALKLSVRKLELWATLWWRLHDPNFNRVFDWSTRMTDGQTDGRWHIARYSIYAVAR